MRNSYCGFIGQRPMSFRWGFDEDDEDCIRLKKMLTAEIAAHVNSGIINFISGMSQGVDLFAAEAVLKLKKAHSDIRLICALPFEEQAKKWSAQQRDRYYGIIERSDKSVLLQEQFSPDCFINCNRWICQYSKYIIAVYNNMPATSTAKMLCHARRSGCMTTVINPDSFEINEYIPDRNRILVCN